jgi:hypothetical protein
MVKDGYFGDWLATFDHQDSANELIYRFVSTPLHWAACYGMIDNARLLVETWPEDKEALNEWGETPLDTFEFACECEPELLMMKEDMSALLSMV